MALPSRLGVRPAEENPLLIDDEDVHPDYNSGTFRDEGMQRITSVPSEMGESGMASLDE